MNIAHKFIHFIGREMKRPPRALAHRPYCNLKTPLPALLAFLKLTKPEFIFVQVGANDGVLQDPLRQWILAFDLNGILVEPQPEMCESLRRLYGDRKSIKIVNAAISESNGARSLFRVPPASTPTEWMKGAASFQRSHLVTHLVNYPEALAAIEEITVRTMTATALFADNEIPREDVLVIDVEGYDYEMLKLFNVAESRPLVLQYEHRHLSRKDWYESVEMLVSSGYLVSHNFEDTLACQASLFPDSLT